MAQFIQGTVGHRGKTEIDLPGEAKDWDNHSVEEWWGTELKNEKANCRGLLALLNMKHGMPSNFSFTPGKLSFD